MNPSLSEKILASKYERMASLADIRSYTSALLSGYRENREAAALALQSALSKEKMERIRSWRNRSSEIRKMMKNIHGNRMHASREQRGWLESFAKEIRRGTGRLVASAHSARTIMGMEMAKEHKAFLHSVRKRVREITSGSRELVGGFAQARMAMSREIEKQLVSCTQDRRVGVRAMLRGFQLQPTHVKTRPARAVDLREGASDEENTLRIIVSHPGGISAMQVGELLGIGAMQVGRIASALAAGGKIHKDERTRRYFPAEAGGEESGEAS